MLVLRREEQGFSVPHDWRYTIDLSAMSPEVEVKPWEERGLYNVQVLTSSGGEEIAAVNSAADGKPQKTNFVEMLFADRADAVKASGFFSKAIRACGGSPRSVQATERAAKEKASHDSASGFIDESTLPPEVVSNLIKACEARVRGQLKAPGSARFTDKPTVGGSKGKGLLIYGKVEAQNAYGGYQELSYMCSADEFGKQYVPGTVSVY